MGVVYKLSSEVRDYILEQKQGNSAISCRQLVDLVSERFQIELSKSSINAIMKDAGLSMPVGRRHKLALKAQIKAVFQAMPEGMMEKPAASAIGSILLKAADCLLGGDLTDVRCIKVDLSDGRSFYLDGQMHTVWSTPNTPYQFSSPLHSITNSINKYLNDDAPLVLFMAPGYEAPTKEFFSFISSFNVAEKPLSLTLYSNKLEILKNVQSEPKKRYFILGLWPWQFGHFLKVKKVGAETEVELSQPDTNQTITLKGGVLNEPESEEIRLFILSNIEKLSPQELTKVYLQRWPNLEEGFRDFSHKIELFSSTTGSQRYFQAELSRGSAEELFKSYLKALDLYVRFYFLPPGYAEKDFPTVNERFYALKAKITLENDFIRAKFEVPAGYAFQKDLQFACQRINEREVIFPDGKKLILALS